MSTVLLVDDNISDRAILRRILGRAGHVVEDVSRGEQAIPRAREIRPHLIVLDVNLPDIDGHQVCRLIRSDPVVSGVPVLMLTVRDHVDDIVAGLEAGADDYVAKDEAAEVVLARVERLVRYRQLSSLAVLNEQLAQIGRLLAGIVHEIRSPLTVIRGNAELLLTLIPVGSDLEEWIEPILRNAQLLQVRLEHLMTAVRIESRSPKATDLTEILDETVDLFMKGSDSRKGKIHLERVVEPGLPLVRIDAGRFMQVLLNLLSNAREAVLSQRSEGRVNVVAGVESIDDGRWVTLKVEDDGPGISPSHLGRIFEPFFTTKESGSGYGLYLADLIIRDHGGTISASNRDEGGARFTIRLPIEEPESDSSDVAGGASTP